MPPPIFKSIYICLWSIYNLIYQTQGLLLNPDFPASKKLKTKKMLFSFLFCLMIGRWKSRLMEVIVHNSNHLSLRIQVCPKNPGFFLSFILFWGWDWDHQSYSREGFGFLEYSLSFSDLKYYCDTKYVFPMPWDCWTVGYFFPSRWVINHILSWEPKGTPPMPPPPRNKALIRPY